MTTVTTLPWGRPLTRADLELMPDDGHRYELLDGMLIVSPSPKVRHQSWVGGLLTHLSAACPGDLKALTAPLDLVLADDTVLQPDVMVCRRAELDPDNWPSSALLVVEVLSPSTRSYDQLLKRRRYAQAGIASYWIVDPVDDSITLLELADAAYVQTGRVEADGSLEVHEPFAVTLAPARLKD